MILVEQLAVILTIAGVVASAVVDLFYRKIPNAYVVILAVCALTYVSVSAPNRIFEHLISGVITLLSCMLLFHRKIIGGGDAKMIAALALWFTPQQLSLFVMWTLICGGALGVIFIGAIFARLAALKVWPKLSLPKILESAGMPYGVATAFGFAIAAWRIH